MNSDLFSDLKNPKLTAHRSPLTAPRSQNSFVQTCHRKHYHPARHTVHTKLSIAAGAPPSSLLPPYPLSLLHTERPLKELPGPSPVFQFSRFPANSGQPHNLIFSPTVFSIFFFFLTFFSCP